MEPDVKHPDLEENLKAAYEVVERRLAAQWSAIDAIDTKINIVLGFASTIVIVLAGFHSLGTKEWPAISMVLFVSALAAYVAVLTLSILAYRTRGWSYRPDPTTLLENSSDAKYDTAALKDWVVEECIASYEKNVRLLENKSRFANWILYAFGVETIALAFGLAYAFSIR